MTVFERKEISYSNTFVWVVFLGLVPLIQCQPYLNISVKGSAPVNFSVEIIFTKDYYSRLYLALCEDPVVTVHVFNKTSNFVDDINTINYTTGTDNSSSYRCGMTSSLSNFLCTKTKSCNESNNVFYLHFLNEQQSNKKNISICSLDFQNMQAIFTYSISSITSNFDIKTSTTYLSSTIIQGSGNDNMNYLPIIIGSCVGGAVVIIIIVIIIVIVLKKINHSNKLKYLHSQTHNSNNLVENYGTKQEHTKSKLSIHKPNEELKNDASVSNEINSVAVIKEDKGNDGSYLKMHSRNTNAKNIYNKNTKSELDEQYSTVDKMKRNETTKNNNLESIGYDNYIDVSLPDQTTSVYSRLGANDRNFHNIYNVSNQTEDSNSQNVTLSKDVPVDNSNLLTEGIVNFRRTKPPYENVIDSQDVYAQVNKPGQNKDGSNKTNSINTTVL